MAKYVPPKQSKLGQIFDVIVLLALIIGVVVLYNMGGLQPSEDAPPAVGAPVGEMKTQAPVDAQPVDPAAGIDVYDDAPPLSLIHISEPTRPY